MKKTLIILIALLCFTITLTAQETEEKTEPVATEETQETKTTAAPKEKPPMYAGAAIGVDGHCGPYINHYFWSFAFEPHFGIYPFSKKNMGIETSLRLVTKNSFGPEEANGSYREAYTALLVRYIYEFKAFESNPSLNLYGIAGAGLAFRKFEWTVYGRGSDSYGTLERKDDEKETRTNLVFPLGVGLRYQIQDKLEAFAQAEFSAGILLGLNISAGINYKF
jgi:hypothetical protein